MTHRMRQDASARHSYLHQRPLRDGLLLLGPKADVSHPQPDRLPARGRPPQAAARRVGLEVVEKLLTSITSGSGLALGQATSRSSWISLGLTADMRDQGRAQLLLGELVA